MEDNNRGDFLPPPRATKTDKEDEVNKHSNDNNNRILRILDKNRKTKTTNTRLLPILDTEKKLLEFLSSFRGNLSLLLDSKEYVGPKNNKDNKDNDKDDKKT